MRPAFVFLAGASAYLYGARGRTKRELSRFLLTRGLWLIFLELTMVRFGWCFSFDYRYIGDAQVIWAIGWSWLCCHIGLFPVRYVAALRIAITLLHHLLDGLVAKSLGGWASLWMFIHERALFNRRLAIHFLSPIRFFPGLESWQPATVSAPCTDRPTSSP